MTMSDPLAAAPESAGPGPAPVGPEMYTATGAVVAPAPLSPPAPPVTGGLRDDLARSLDVLGDVEMSVTVELGRTRLPVRQLLALTPGSVIELNRSANTPVDILVNDTLFARGEVVVIDDEFGVRITELVRREAGPGRS